MNRQGLHSFLHSIGEAITPVLKNSKFHETGKLTPEEFVAAGDYIHHTCPTWEWQAGDANRTRSALPNDKQYLSTRNVPCFKRCKDMHYNKDDEQMVGLADDGDGDDDDWVATHISESKQDDDNVHDITDMTSDMASSSIAPRAATAVASDSDSSDDDEDIPDMDEFDDADNLIEEDDPSALPAGSSMDDATDNILRTRTYDLHITYDLYYQTPRMFLFGYDEHRNPLTVEQMFEDISADHAQKTITMEQHPHLSLTMASIHPCKHAAVMKKLVAAAEENGKSIPVYLYMMIFLKFVQSVIPTIEYDFTRELSIA